MKPQYDHAITFVWVKDWDRAIRFYSDILGFTKDYDSDGWAEFRVPGVKDTYIAINRWVQDEEHPINRFITLRVQNIKAFRAHLEENKVKIAGPTDEFIEEGQGLSMFKFLDSDGNILTAAQIHN